ncbi:hypothetical protein ACJX0J_013617, partial [Zea mays]
MPVFFVAYVKLTQFNSTVTRIVFMYKYGICTLDIINNKLLIYILFFLRTNQHICRRYYYKILNVFNLAHIEEDDEEAVTAALAWLISTTSSLSLDTLATKKGHSKLFKIVFSPFAFQKHFLILFGAFVDLDDGFKELIIQYIIKNRLQYTFLKGEVSFTKQNHTTTLPREKLTAARVNVRRIWFKELLSKLTLHFAKYCILVSHNNHMQAQLQVYNDELVPIIHGHLIIRWFTRIWTQKNVLDLIFIYSSIHDPLLVVCWIHHHLVESLLLINVLSINHLMEDTIVVSEFCAFLSDNKD